MKKLTFYKLTGIILIATMMLSFSACAKQQAVETAVNNTPTPTQAETKLDQIKKAGKLVIGTSADYPPYEFHKQVNGKDEIVGFDIMIAQQIAAELGVQLEVKDITFNGLLESLQADKIDMVIAGMNPSEERAKEVDFSKIYYQAIQSILVRAEDADKYKELADLNGKKVGVQLGSVQEALAKKVLTGSEAKSLGKVTDLALELKNKKVDALVVEYPVAASYAEKNSDLAIAEAKFDPSTIEQGSAIAFKKGSPEFVDAVNKILDKLIQDKTIDKLFSDANSMVE